MRTFRTRLACASAITRIAGDPKVIASNWVKTS